MSDDDEPVGSLAEEAARLFGALSDLAREQGAGVGGTAAGVSDRVAAAAHEVSDHLATGGQDCTYCPVCRTIHLVRQTSPEVRAQLGIAASALMQAAAGLLETNTADRRSAPRGPVEHIDLEEDES